MIDSATAIRDEEFLVAEHRHIKATFLHNGYPLGLTSSVIRQRTTRPGVVLTSQNVPLLVLPYCKGLGEKVRQMGKEIGFKVYFKTSSSLRSMVRHDKIRLPLEEKPGIVYEVMCSCSASYIGETGNSVCQRFNQHLSCLSFYKNALSDLEGKETRRRGRPRKIVPQAARLEFEEE
ncbi:hypothetical protein M514_02805 [Trichuris suis]|uniref:GIY-YIG domain-containing protein n=1 Tax=Trichuris suis TaxID=68888 RepID=A0A085MGK4_9BILA|nr:hypothetical protein M513_02805 [Trichuris suis]KFD63773.1 hypothetical protein M514_02805 [Trichuris suis]